MAMRRYQRSVESIKKARRVIPGGAQTLSKMPERFPEGAFPAVLNSGQGNHVYDMDGNRYLDYICGLGAVTLGYKHPKVTAWVSHYMGEPTFSLPHFLETMLAERLVNLIPSAEMVRFAKTGSEAAEGAIRVARAATGREIILSCGYHSWHSWYAAMKPSHPGVPHAMTELARSFPYNDLDSLGLEIRDSFIRSNGPAAIIIEPTLIQRPDLGFLEGVYDLAKKHGAVLIFDEMVTGFRWDVGGYQHLCGITPDLSLFGKGMANGYPLACVVGKRELMEDWGRLASGTFGGELVSIAAAMGVLDVYEDRDICGNMRDKGAYLIKAFPPDFGYPYLEGQPWHPRWAFDTEEQKAHFFQETARRGLLFHPGGFNIPGLLTEAELSHTIDMVGASLEGMKTLKFEGKLIQAHPFRTTS